MICNKLEALAERLKEQTPIAQWLWWALLAAVPVTSFPLVHRTIGGETVSPLSLLPLIGLLVVWLVPHLLADGRIPREVGPLLLFAVFALGSSVLAQFLNIEPYKGQTTLSRSVRGLATLSIGIGFYLCAALITLDKRRLRASLRALYLGLHVAVLWSLAQAWYIYFKPGYVPPALNQIHRLFSIRDLFWDRVTGLAFEPSWYGNQLVILYLPLLLGSILCGSSAFGRRRVYLLIELTLTALSILTLVLARSRLSMASLLMVGIALAIYAVWRTVGWALQRFGFNPSARSSASLRLALVVAGVSVVAFGAGVVSYQALERDQRTRRLLSAPAQLQSIQRAHPYQWVYAIADRGAFAERLVYWNAALLPFARFPLTGVGLGNAGFYFEAGVPAYGHQLTEIRTLLEASSPNFPNPKSLWIRLLAETGTTGFAGFAVWLAVLAAGGVWLASKGRGADRAIGVAGLVGLLAQLIEGFSVDTFALPQFWLLMGLLTAAIWRLRRARQFAVPHNRRITGPANG